MERYKEMNVTVKAEVERATKKQTLAFDKYYGEHRKKSKIPLSQEPLVPCRFSILEQLHLPFPLLLLLHDGVHRIMEISRSRHSSTPSSGAKRRDSSSSDSAASSRSRGAGRHAHAMSRRHYRRKWVEHLLLLHHLLLHLLMLQRETNSLDSQMSLGANE